MKKHIRNLLILACSFSIAIIGTATAGTAVTSLATSSTLTNSLNWVEVSKTDLSTQVMFDFTHPIYFKKQINKNKSQLLILFENIDSQTALKSEIIDELKKLEQTGIINSVNVKSNSKTKQAQLSITFVKDRTIQKNGSLKTIPNQILIKWNQIENPNRLVIDFYKQETLNKIENQNTTILQAHNDAPKNNSFFFGQKKRSLNQPLRIVLDPGHGGEEDSGAISSETGIKEKDLTLQIAKRVRSLLKKTGINVLLTRSIDTHVPLVKRSELAEQLQADLFVSLHINATDAPNPTATGIETFHPNNDEINKNCGFMFFNMPHKPALTKKLTHFINNTATASEQLATSIQTNLLDNLHNHGFQTRDRGVKKGMYRLLIRNSMPSVLVEIGFITNMRDAVLLSNSNYQDCVAGGIVTGIKKILK